jgi:hypothetical protein
MLTFKYYVMVRRDVGYRVSQVSNSSIAFIFRIKQSKKKFKFVHSVGNTCSEKKK